MLPMITAKCHSRLRALLGGKRFELRQLRGGASDRWYLRAAGRDIERFTGSPTAVLMGIDPRLRHVIQHFGTTRAFLEAEGLPVPACYGEIPEGGIWLLEDLGDRVLTAVAQEPHARGPLYESVAQLLSRLHSVPRNTGRCPAMLLHFDRAKYGFEFDFHVRKWLIGAYFCISPTPGQRCELDRAFRWIASILASAPRVFTHRDFQSSNLMLRGNDDLAIVDFQDARQGVRAYDVASLVYDSYVNLSKQERRRFEECYLECTSHSSRPSPEEFHRLVVVAGLQRKLHDAGAFIYAAHARGKTAYLDWVPDTLDLIALLAAEMPETRMAGEVLAELRQRSGVPR